MFVHSLKILISTFPLNYSHYLPSFSPINVGHKKISTAQDRPFGPSCLLRPWYHLSIHGLHCSIPACSCIDPNASSMLVSFLPHSLAAWSRHLHLAVRSVSTFYFCLCLFLTLSKINYKLLRPPGRTETPPLIIYQWRHSLLFCLGSPSGQNKSTEV